MPDEPVREDASLMPCDHPGCVRESTHSRAVWVTPGHMKVEYYCPEHAPADATTFEEDGSEILTPQRASLEKLVVKYPAPPEWYDEPEWNRPESLP